MPDSDPVAVGGRIKALRQLLKWSQPALARRVDVHPQTVWRWEHGDRLPDTEELIRLSVALAVTVDQLLFGGKSAVEVPEMLRAFFASDEGKRLRPNQQLALVELLDGETVDTARLNSALFLLFGERSKKS